MSDPLPGSLQFGDNLDVAHRDDEEGQGHTDGEDYPAFCALQYHTDS